MCFLKPKMGLFRPKMALKRLNSPKKITSHMFLHVSGVPWGPQKLRGRDFWLKNVIFKAKMAQNSLF